MHAEMLDATAADSEVVGTDLGRVFATVPKSKVMEVYNAIKDVVFRTACA